MITYFGVKKLTNTISSVPRGTVEFVSVYFFKKSRKYFINV